MTVAIFTFNKMLNIIIPKKGPAAGSDSCCLCSVNGEDDGFAVLLNCWVADVCICGASDEHNTTVTGVWREDASGPLAVVGHGGCVIGERGLQVRCLRAVGVHISCTKSLGWDGPHLGSTVSPIPSGTITSYWTLSDDEKKACVEMSNTGASHVQLHRTLNIYHQTIQPEGYWLFCSREGTLEKCAADWSVVIHLHPVGSVISISASRLPSVCCFFTRSPLTAGVQVCLSPWMRISRENAAGKKHGAN